MGNIKDVKTMALDTHNKYFEKVDLKKLTKQQQDNLKNAYDKVQQNISAKNIEKTNTCVSSLKSWTKSGLKVAVKRTARIAVSSYTEMMAAPGPGNGGSTGINLTEDMSGRAVRGLAIVSYTATKNIYKKRKNYLKNRKALKKFQKSSAIQKSSELRTSNKGIRVRVKKINSKSRTSKLNKLNTNPDAMRLKVVSKKRQKGKVKKIPIMNAIGDVSGYMLSFVSDLSKNASGNSDLAGQIGSYAITVYTRLGKRAGKLLYAKHKKSKIAKIIKKGNSGKLTTEQMLNKLSKLYTSDTFSYLLDSSLQNAYQYEPKKRRKRKLKKEHTVDSGLTGIKKNPAIKNKTASPVTKSNSAINKTNRNITYKPPKIKPKNAYFRKYKYKVFQKNNLHFQIKNAPKNVAEIMNRMSKKIVVKSKMVFVIIAVSATLYITIMPAVGGVAAVMEGFAVVVEFLEDAVDTAKTWIDNVADFAGNTWDSLRAQFVDTHGADKVDLDNIMSVNEFIHGMVDLQYESAEDIKAEYEAKGYTVTIGNYNSSPSGPSGTGESDPQINGAKWSDVDYIRGELLDEGYSEAATAGIIGNLCRETTGINPKSLSPSGYYGICQWSTGRTSNLKSYCQLHFFDWQTLKGQLDFLIHSEMPAYYKDLNSFKNKTDPSDAAASFDQIVEASDGSTRSDRISFANIVYEHYKNEAKKENSKTENKKKDKKDNSKTANEKEKDNSNSANSTGSDSKLFVDEVNKLMIAQAYDKEQFFQLLKPLWLSVMYGKYEYEPTEMEMADTAENICDILSTISVNVNEQNKTVTIYVRYGGTNDVLAEYYTNEIDELKSKDELSEDEEADLMKLENDYELALDLLDYYHDDLFDGTGSSDIDLSAIKDRSANEKIQKMIELAYSKIGNPYVYGGTDIDHGIDCSAFVQWLYKQVGISISRTSSAQCKLDGVYIKESELQPGDLIFYSSDGTYNTVSHVAFYIGNGEIIHASTEKTGIKKSIYNYQEGRIYKRIIQQDDSSETNKKNNKKEK